MFDDQKTEFGPFTFRSGPRVLLHRGQPVALGERALDLLAVLIAADGRMLSKSELLDRVWPGRAVEENNLHTQISALRRALGDERGAIRTVAGRGYRFVLPPPQREAPAPMAPAHDSRRFSVAVCRFLDLGAAETLAQGVAASLRTDLARALPNWRIFEGSPQGGSQGGSQGSPGGGHDAVHHEENYRIEGSAEAQPDRVRINARLVETAGGTQLWGERFDMAHGADGLSLQDGIVARLTRMAVLRLLAAEARRLTANEEADAEVLTLRGKATAMVQHMSSTSAGAARDLFRMALALAPDSVDALAGLAIIEAYAALNGFTPPAERNERLAEANALAGRALALEPTHPEALRARMVALRAQGHFADAIAAGAVLRAQLPYDPASSHELGLNRLYLGENEAAIAAFHQADLAGPHDPERWTWQQGLGRALMHVGRYGEAVEALRIVVQTNPKWSRGYALLAVALRFAGEPDSAREAFAAYLLRASPEEIAAPPTIAPVPAERVSDAYRQGEAPIREMWQRLRKEAADQASAGPAADVRKRPV